MMESALINGPTATWNGLTFIAFCIHSEREKQNQTSKSCQTNYSGGRLLDVQTQIKIVLNNCSDGTFHFKPVGNAHMRALHHIQELHSSSKEQLHPGGSVGLQCC